MRKKSVAQHHRTEGASEAKHGAGLTEASDAALRILVWKPQNATGHKLFLTKLKGSELYYWNILATEQGGVESREIQGRNTG